MSIPIYTQTFHITGNTQTPVREVQVHATPEEIGQLVHEGYLVRENLLSPDQIERLRDAVDEVAARERTAESEFAKSRQFGGQFLRHLFDKHETFWELLNFPPTVSVARAVLGPAVQSRLSARITFPNVPGQQTQWHFHERTIPQPLPPFFVFPHSIDVLIYLDDLTDESGPVALVPRSHIGPGNALSENDFADKPDQVILRLQAGDGVFIHNNLWHRGMASGPKATMRRMLALTYSSCWLKNVDDGRPPANGLTQKLLDTADQETLELLGVAGY